MAGWCLVGLSGVAHAAGQPRRAARLLGAAEQVTSNFRPGTTGLVERLFASVTAGTRTALGESAFVAALDVRRRPRRSSPPSMKAGALRARAFAPRSIPCCAGVARRTQCHLHLTVLLQGRADPSHVQRGCRTTFDRSGRPLGNATPLRRMGPQRYICYLSAAAPGLGSASGVGVPVFTKW
jgi:hypothetical protein